MKFYLKLLLFHIVTAFWRVRNSIAGLFRRPIKIRIIKIPSLFKGPKLKVLHQSPEDLQSDRLLIEKSIQLAKEIKAEYTKKMEDSYESSKFTPSSAIRLQIEDAIPKIQNQKKFIQEMLLNKPDLKVGDRVQLLAVGNNNTFGTVTRTDVWDDHVEVILDDQIYSNVELTKSLRKIS